MKTIEAKEYSYNKYEWTPFWLGIGSIALVYWLGKYSVRTYQAGMVAGVTLLFAGLALFQFIDSIKHYKVQGKRYLRTKYEQKPMSEQYNTSWKEED